MQLAWLVPWLAAGCARDEEAAVWAAYQSVHEAIAAGDLETLRTRVTAEHAANVEGEDAQAALEIARAMMPQDVERVGLVVEGDEATLTLRGRQFFDEGATRREIPAEGTVRLRKQAGSWKIAKEDWSLKMELGAFPSEAQSFAREGQRMHPQLVLRGHAAASSQLAATPNWRFLVSASYGDRTLRVWDLSDGRQASLLSLENRPSSLAVSAAGDVVIVADATGTVWQIPLDFAGGLGAPEALLADAGQHAALSPDGRWLAATSANEPIVIYDRATRAALYELAGSEALRSSRFSPAGDLLVGSEGNRLLVWNTQDWSAQAYALPEVDPGSTNAEPVFSPDGRYVGLACGDSSIVVFDLKARSVLHDFFVSGAAALAFAFSPDGQQFATAQNNQQINVWSMEDHKRVNYILGRKSNAQALLFSPDGRMLAAAHEDREIVFWQAFDPGEKPPVREVAAVPVAGSGAPAGGATAPAPASASGDAARSLLGETNYLDNPAAAQGAAGWQQRGDAAIEPCVANDPCFLTRYDGEFEATALLPADAPAGFLLLIGRASAERVRRPGSQDQTGEAYIHGYGEPANPSAGIGEHYSAETLVSRTQESGSWSTIWGVFPLNPQIRRVRLTLRQADGHSAKDGSASRFDDLGVLLFPSPERAQAFAEEYEREFAKRTARAGSSDVQHCEVNGSLLFTSAARCAQLSGRLR